MVAAVWIAAGVAVAATVYAASEAEDAEDAQNAARKAQQRSQQMQQARQNMAAMREAQRQRALAVQRGVAGGTSGSSSSMLGASRAGQQASSAIGYGNAIQEYSNAQFMHMQDAYGHMAKSAEASAFASVASQGVGFAGSFSGGTPTTKPQATKADMQAMNVKKGYTP